VHDKFLRPTNWPVSMALDRIAGEDARSPTISLCLLRRICHD
jgi:hypothetical protein